MRRVEKTNPPARRTDMKCIICANNGIATDTTDTDVRYSLDVGNTRPVTGRICAACAEQCYPIEIETFPSLGIRAEAKTMGATRMREIARRWIDEVLYRHFAIGTTDGEVEVIDTNSDPVFDGEDGWDEMVEKIGGAGEPTWREEEA
jgi:hypothetical protein